MTFHNFGTGVIPTNGGGEADSSVARGGGRTAVNVVVYNLQVQVPGMSGWFVKVAATTDSCPGVS